MENNNTRSPNVDNSNRSKAGQGSSGNFKNDPQRASEAGRKGGLASGNKKSQDSKTSR